MKTKSGCTAPTNGHTGGGEANCPVHGQRSASLGSVDENNMWVRRRARAATTPPQPLETDDFEPAHDGEEVVNGLVVRPMPSYGGFTLVHASTGLPVFDYLSRAAGRGRYATEEEALEWARDTFPFFSSLAKKYRPERRIDGPECQRCGGKTYAWDKGDNFTCVECWKETKR